MLFTIGSSTRLCASPPDSRHPNQLQAGLAVLSIAAWSAGGSPFTGWESTAGDAQSLTLDLGSVRDIATARLLWGVRRPLEYVIQVSTDKVNWTQAAHVTRTTTSDAVDLVTVNSTTRYVRMLGVTSLNQAGYSVLEFQVFTCGVGPVDCTNSPPIAVVGPPQLAFKGEQVSLKGTASFDPDNDPAENPFLYINGLDDQFTYKWTLTTKPSGSGAVVTNANSAVASVVPDKLGTYVATLVVTDGDGGGVASVPASTVIDVVSPQLVAATGLTQAVAVANSLTLSDVTSADTRQAIINLVTQAYSDCQSGRIKKALEKVDSALARTDGWSLRGAADTTGPTRDWVITQGPATALYSALSGADAALRAM